MRIRIKKDKLRLKDLLGRRINIHGVRQKDYKEKIQAPLDRFPEEELDTRDVSLNYFQGKIAGWLLDLGMNVDEGTGFEMSDGADNLRIYKLSEDGMIWKNPFEDDTTYDSPEFFDKIKMWRIIAFPPGEKHPVQFQLNPMELALSKPITEPFTPKPPEPTRPGAWARFANFITRGRAYRKEFEDYNKSRELYEQKNAVWKAKSEKLQDLTDRRTPEILKAEEQQLEKYQNMLKERSEMEESRAFRDKLDQMEEDYSNCAIEQYMNAGGRAPR